MYTYFTPFDINKIYKSREAVQLLLWITKLNKWMSNVTKSPISTEFSVLVLIAFLLKIYIIGMAILI